jgi:hypothetical protein
LRFGSSAAVSTQQYDIEACYHDCVYFTVTVSFLLSKALGKFKRLFDRFEILTLKKGTFGAKNDL